MKCVCVVGVLCGWLFWTTKKRLVVEEFNFRLAMFELICVCGGGGTTVVTIVTVLNILVTRILGSQKTAKIIVK